MSADPAVEAWRDAHAAHARRLLEQTAVTQGIGPIKDVAAWMKSVAAPEDIPAADLEAWDAALRARHVGLDAVITRAIDAERERIAAALDQAADFYDHPEIWPTDSQHPEAVSARAMRTAYRIAARLIRQRQLPGDDEPTDDDTEKRS